MKFTQIPVDTFKRLELNAGVLAKAFSINASTGVGTLTRSNIIGATSGGITITAVPTFADFGEDIDNCPKNTKELKRITAWDIKVTGTFVTFGESLAALIGQSEVSVYSATLTTDTTIVPGKTYYARSGSGTEASPYRYIVLVPTQDSQLASLYDNPVFKLIPVHDHSGHQVEDASYGFMTHLWFVGDYSDANDGNNAGYLACYFKNSLSTGGFSMTTQDMEKGKFAFEFTAHYTLDDPEEVPFEMYVRTTST